MPVEKIQELKANHCEYTGEFPLKFTALKIQAKIAILQEIQELQAGVPGLPSKYCTLVWVSLLILLTDL